MTADQTRTGAPPHPDTPPKGLYWAEDGRLLHECADAPDTVKVVSRRMRWAPDGGLLAYPVFSLGPGYRVAPDSALAVAQELEALSRSERDLSAARNLIPLVLATIAAVVMILEPDVWGGVAFALTGFGLLALFVLSPVLRMRRSVRLMDLLGDRVDWPMTHRDTFDVTRSRRHRLRDLVLLAAVGPAAFLICLLALWQIAMAPEGAHELLYAVGFGALSVATALFTLRGLRAVFGRAGETWPPYRA